MSGEPRPDGAPADIGTLPNLGPKSAAALRRAGIGTVAELERVGPVEAFVRTRHVWEGASPNLLWALAAGLRGVAWNRLDPAEKAQLRAALAALVPDAPSEDEIST